MRLPLFFALLCVCAFLMAAGTTAPAFQFECTTTAQRIEPSGAGVRRDYRSITVWNAVCSSGTCATSTTPVFLGGHYTTGATPSVVAAVTTDTGMPICSSSSACIAGAATYDVSNLQCIVASGTVTVTVQVAR